MKLFALTVAALLGAAVADTPNHCLYSDTLGTWNFYLSANDGDNTITCPQDQKDIKVAKTLTITLSEPDVAFAGDGTQGFWTMMYDEGFHVHIDSEGVEQRFFAYQNWTTLANGTTQSNCGLTNVGFFHDAPDAPGVLPRNWGCYYAELASADKPINVKPPVQRLSVSPHARIVEDAAFAAAINAEQSLWKASPKHAFHGMPARQAMRRLGQFVHDLPHDVKPRISAKHTKTLSVEERSTLPDEWDWRNVNNVSYVCPVRNQGQCGSCYSFGSTGSLCSRTAIAGGAELTQRFWSPQTVVSCSPYSQGCDGGFAYNVFKYAEDWGIPWDTCFTYQSSTGTAPPCYAKCNDTRQYNYVTDNQFVGGYYGASTAELMQREILVNGPISVEFFVYPDFSHYTGGIYVHTKAAESNLQVNPWEPTNHEVHIVGWGVENGTPYWIVQNSWGTAWGESGYFRILRGADECAIESIPAAATPVIPAGAADLYASLTA